jgi:hypothetical protein
MATSTIGDITVLFIFGVLVFFACVYLSGRDVSGRAIGAGIKGDGNRWQSDKNEANHPTAAPCRAVGVARSEADRAVLKARSDTSPVGPGD